ncbi:MmcQ/YjbR family DNA-binding protein [Microbacterium sp. NPDC055683]
MDGRELHDAATAAAHELPGMALEYPFGPEWDVFKVRGKVFLLQTTLRGSELVTVKAHPDDAVALRAEFPDISPGYHMNKRHWISLRPGPSLSEPLVREVVTESYLRVVETLPRAIRPVDPTLFGR